MQFPEVLCGDFNSFGIEKIKNTNRDNNRDLQSTVFLFDVNFMQIIYDLVTTKHFIFYHLSSDKFLPQNIENLTSSKIFSLAAGKTVLKCPPSYCQLLI